MREWVSLHRGTLIEHVLVIGVLVFVLAHMQSKFDLLDERTTPYAPITITEVQAEPESMPRTGEVILAFRFCNSSRANVRGVSSLAWEAVHLDGSWVRGQAQTLFSGIDPGDIPPGCTVASFPVLMPVTAQRIDVDLDQAGIPHRWVLTGSFNPSNPDGSGFGQRAPIVSAPIDVTH